MTVQIKTNVIARTNILYRTLIEFVKAVIQEDEGEFYDLIKYGVLNKKKIVKLIIVIYDENDKKISEVSLKINWFKHSLYLKAKGKKISIDNNKSISEQISEILPIIYDSFEELWDCGLADSYGFWIIYKPFYKFFLSKQEKKILSTKFRLFGIDSDRWRKGKYLDYKFVPGKLKELMIKVKSKL